ncbi:hypothetical protein FMM05_10010 [Flavobacterium zepuense]|uniref:Outer membrane protein beta-barrel domain-containing protein n=1 Tax=Flavobacterium zepuense TaxID=2593302 RepID=A0A552V2X2_9FLAO|nr:hypothetical protein [Flavobacterium zepuense]TRW24824.1 hypothetical protein FMM05_10010 [Flavobacterium zepuense]
MRKLSLLFFLLFATILYAQDSQSGYYITNGGQRVEGQFLETNYLDVSTLKFKTESGKNFESLDIENIKEFGVGEDYKAVKHTVQIDATDASQGQVSANKDATWKKQTILLNVLVEGDAILYSYTSGKGTKYFYKVDGKQMEPEQLLYRKYMAGNLATAENNKYRQQLYNDLNCTGTNDMNKFLKIAYSKKDLAPLFEEYNKCKKSANKVYDNNSGKRTKVFYSVFAGLYNGKFNIDGIANKVEDDKYFTVTAGGEILALLPSGKIGFFLKAEYESLNSELVSVYKSPYGGVTQTTTTYVAKGSLFNFHLGPRYYYNINDKNKVYLDGAVVFTLPTADLDQRAQVSNNTDTYDSVNLYKVDFGSTMSFNFGVGYTLNNKFSLEARVNTSRDLFSGYDYTLKTKSTLMGLNLKYTIN